MKLRWICFPVVLLIFFCLTGCQNDSDKLSQDKEIENSVTSHENREYADLPGNINWLTNGSDPVFSSDKALKGGSLHSAITSFPMTFRVVGPDSNGSFRSAIL